MKDAPTTQDEGGFTLVEVVASLVLIMILLTFFMNFLIQSAKINHRSEEMVDATSIAQTEMERILAASKKYSVADRAAVFNHYPYMYQEAEWEVWKKDYQTDRNLAAYTITVKLSEVSTSPDLMKIILEVEHTKNKQTYAVMQHVLKWKDSLSHE